MTSIYLNIQAFAELAVFYVLFYQPGFLHWLCEFYVPFFCAGAQQISRLCSPSSVDTKDSKNLWERLASPSKYESQGLQL